MSPFSIVRPQTAPLRRFAVAPMLDWTDRHCRFFMRLISRRAWLYTEMITTGAILRGEAARLLEYNAEEQPLALQLGGSDPGELARCARLGEQWGYAEINLNLGCPSDRVQSGHFGACLMAEPRLVADCLRAMVDAVDIPVTVKCRIGIDRHESYDQFRDFVGRLTEAGAASFIVHARKAWLQGLSPKENRDIPPLRYDWVYRLKQDLPSLEILLNGGITSLEQAAGALRRIDGVMLGRAAYRNPYLLSQVDRRLFGDGRPVPSRERVVEELLPYVEAQRREGVALARITRHILGLFQGAPGARIWRQHLSQHAHHRGAGPEVIIEALQKVRGVAGPEPHRNRPDLG
jgi:tRNA-dihydrouridine synthase A